MTHRAILLSETSIPALACRRPETRIVLVDNDGRQVDDVWLTEIFEWRKGRREPPK